MSTIINPKYFKYAFFLLILAEILSYFGWLNYWINTICFIVIILATVILSLKKLEYGLYILFAELFVGSKGYLFSLNLGGTILSIRMGIFLVVMGVWVTHELLQIIKRIDINKFCHSVEKQNPEKKEKNNITTPTPPLKGEDNKKYILLLAVVVFWAFVWGMIRGNDFGNVFLDFNNWLYFLLMFPVMSVIARPPLAPPYKGGDNKHEFISKIITILCATAVIIFLKTIFLFYIFTHQISLFLPEIYKWVRDTGVGEITNMDGGFYRVFIQSQIYALFSFFIFLPLLQFLKKLQIPNHKSQTNSKFQIQKFSFITPYSLFITIFVTIILSFSRSYWLALIITLLFYFLIILFKKLGIVFLKSFAKLLTIATISLGLIILTLYLPPKIKDLDWTSVFGKRATQGEAASSSRINQLNPLLLAIAKHPLIGSGFGTTVTYKSNDPRIVNETAGRSGLITTYAFEWGYLDMVLKFGMLGTGIYLFLIFKILRRLLKLQITKLVLNLIQDYKLQINPNIKIQNSYFLDPDFRQDDNEENYSLSPYGGSPAGRQINSKFQISNNKQNQNALTENKNSNYRLQITDYRLQFGFALALIALLIVNIFSPYLNHPLGIGFVILSFAFTCPEQSRRMF